MAFAKAPSVFSFPPFCLLFLLYPVFLSFLLGSLPLIPPCLAAVADDSYRIALPTSSSFSDSSSSSSSPSVSSTSVHSSSSSSSIASLPSPPPSLSSSSNSSSFASSSSSASRSSSSFSVSSFSPISKKRKRQQIRAPPQQEPVMACYYGSWAVYRPGQGKFDVEDIDPFLCTHVLYAFAGLQESTGTIISLDPWNDLYDNYGKGGYIRFTSLKKINPNLKTLLSIGGWNEGSRKYSEMASSASSRATFIASCIKFLLKYGFDGLDLDWEYPTQRGGRPEDKVNFALLLDEMRSKFKQRNLMLTAAVSAGKATIDAAYNVTALASNLDYVFLMAYDFHGAWETFAHHHSPLFAYSQDKGVNKVLNVDFAVKYWLGAGLPPRRLVLGMGLYGRCFTLARADQHDVYAPAPQPGLPGPYTRTPGMLGYNELCVEQLQVPWTVVRDKNIVSPYAFHERQWCGYDDTTSVTTKAKYLQSLGLAGAMVWSIETDDFHGDCQTEEEGEDQEEADQDQELADQDQEEADQDQEEQDQDQGKMKFPLITTIRTVLRGGEPIPTPTPAPIYPPTTETTTTTSTTTPPPTPPPPPPPPPPPSNICHREGLNRDPAGDCTIFYICHQVGDTWLAWLFHCPKGTRFVEEMQACDHPEGHETCPLLPPVTDSTTTPTTTTTTATDSADYILLYNSTINNSTGGNTITTVPLTTTPSKDTVKSTNSKVPNNSNIIKYTGPHTITTGPATTTISSTFSNRMTTNTPRSINTALSTNSNNLNTTKLSSVTTISVSPSTSSANINHASSAPHSAPGVLLPLADINYPANSINFLRRRFGQEWKTELGHEPTTSPLVSSLLPPVSSLSSSSSSSSLSSPPFSRSHSSSSSLDPPPPPPPPPLPYTPLRPLTPLRPTPFNFPTPRPPTSSLPSPPYGPSSPPPVSSLLPPPPLFPVASNAR